MIIIGFFFLNRRENSAPVIEEITASPSPSPAGAPAAAGTVNLTRSGGRVNAAELNIKRGDTVVFVNNDSILWWPASGVHPIHQICPGFDSLRGLGKDESYSFTFNNVGTCPFHDHLDARNGGLLGKINVR